jgi:hypothetical protein
MELYKITKSDLADFFEPHATISEIFTWLETDFMMQSKLVCQFIINGYELSESDEIDWAAKPLALINDIQIKVQDERDLVGDVVEAWIEALPEIIGFIESIALQNSQGSKVFNVKEILKLVHQQETFVSSLMSLKAPLKRYGLEIQDWDTAEKSLHEYVVQCVNHLEKKNFVQLIETLEYDGASALDQWRCILQTMKEKIGNHAPVERTLSLPSSGSVRSRTDGTST